MKLTNLFSIVLLLGILPCPAHSGENFSDPKIISFETFEKDMLKSANTFSTGTDCSFAASSKIPGILLIVRSEQGNVKLAVSNKSEIYRVKETEESTEYTITGLGSVKLTHAADAFERVSITSNKTNITIGCEIDY